MPKSTRLLTGTAVVDAPTAAATAEALADVEVAAEAYDILWLAAYEPAEQNNGARVWRGRELTAAQQQDVGDGLEVCESY
jgi:hypothetical protein